MTFDVTAVTITRVEYGWQQWYEAFGVCRKCRRTAVFVLSERGDGDHGYVHKTGLLKVEGALNRYVDVEGHISLKDAASIDRPITYQETLSPRSVRAQHASQSAAITLAARCSGCV